MVLAEPVAIIVPKALKTAILAVVAYGVAAVAAGLVLEISSNSDKGLPDAERVFGIAFIVGSIVWPVVLGLKLVMIRSGRDGLPAHVLNGCGVGAASSVVILAAYQEPLVLAAFALAGAVAGGVYWTVRQCGRRVFGGDGV